MNRMRTGVFTATMSALILVPFIAGAQSAGGVSEYQPLAGLPKILGKEATTLVDYLNVLFTLLIAVAAVVAVLRIVIAGFEYMFATDHWASKEEAKSRIWAVITGLIMLLLSYLILSTINPNLVKFNLLQPKGSSISHPIDHA